jgi:lytic transglycosylase, catalytic|nr:MAG TPA: Large polyvalent protein associated domain 38 [Caudoviricetes sp.]
MDFFQRVGNFFSGKGWVSDEEKRRKEQQVQAQPQNKPAVTFKQDPVLNNLNKAPSFGSPSPTQGLFQQKQETPKTDTVPKVNTVPTANQFTKPVVPEIKPEIPQKTINDAPKVLTPQGQQDWVNKENKQIQTQNLVNKPIITPKKPTYFDYLNPFGEHGLFGAKQQQNFKQTVEKPITDNINKFNNWIDSSDKEKGFQWSDPGDYLRFAAKIPGGMVQGLAETPNKVANAVTGIEADENGKVKELNGVQRFGKGLDAGISVGGLGFGGSGTLLRSLAGLGKAGTKQAVKQGIGRTVLNGTKNLVKDSLKEGAEEVTQTFAQDLADDGNINTDKNTYFQSGAFGALGGGMMHGAGRAVNGVKGMVGNRINPYGENGVGINRLSPSQMKYNAAEVVGGITGDTRKRLSQAAFGDLQKARTGNPYRTSDGMDVELSRNGNRKMTATSQKTPSEMFNVQQRLAPKIQEAIEKSKQIDSNIDTKEHGFANDGFSYNEVPVRYRGKDYVTTFDIGSNNNKNLLYNATTRKSPMEPAGTNPSTELHHLGDSHVDSVAQEAQNVNEDVKYKLNPEHEAQVRAYNEHITRLRQREEYLRGQGMSENAPAMINLRKAQEQAIYARDHIGEVDENGLKYKLSPEQETFFKDSKIRDENGNLKTVYHGTNSEFDQFSPLAGSSSSTRNRWGEGNYLAYDKDMANGYGVNLKEMYANITSPITNNQKTVSFDQYDALHRRVNNGEPAYREDYDMYDNDMDLLWDITDNGQWKKYAQDIKDTTGKDGVIMDDMAITFSPNQTKYTNNLNPTDSPDMRYKLGAKMQELASQNKLLARHLQLTGDENLVFNEWQNEMQKKALGYYDPKTDQINLNKLTEDTLNHELGHKLLTRVENKQDLLNSIRESYGDDYLINKYGSQYGNDLNLLAEEQLADGFSDYYNGRLNGEDKVRLGTRLGIPQKVLAIYDRITEAVMGLVGKQDAIKQFYAQMETGKFRNEVFGNTEQLPAYKKSDSSADVDSYVNDLVKEQKLARKGEQPTLRERWQDFKEDMREKFVDRFAPIEDRIKNKSEQLEMRNALDRTLRADGISEAFIRDNNFDKLITGFKNKKELQTFDQALTAKHALELEANGIETGRNLAKDKALVKATSKRFAKEFKQVREYSDKVLQQTVDYGLISQDTANYLRKKYPDYVPFDRIFSDKELATQMKHGVGVGEASLSKQDIVQRIKGSSRSIDSPLNALITKTQDMIQQGERNKTAELLASYAKDPKNPFQLRELKPDESADGRPTISYLDNGKKRTFLAAPEVARAAKNMNREQMGIILRALATPARLLRMGATTVNAGFTMANVVKDFVGATVNSKGGINSMNPKSIVSALGAAFHHNGDLYAEMQREGVLGNIYELTRNASDLNLNEIRSHKNILTRSIHNAKSPLKTLENTIGRSEDFGRALQYVANKKYAKRKGMSESEAIKFAADQARWNSTNFLRSGTYGKAINAIVPYSNANIQGQRITLRRMKENPARYTGKIALGIVAPTVAAMALSYSNDENKKIMENLPDYVKENNVVVIGPGAKYNKEQNKWEGVYLVPVPPQFSPLHRQLHNMVRSAMTGQQFDTGKAVGDAVEQVTTVNPMEIRRTGAQYVPQAVKPFVETWANKNLYTGQEVVPEGMKNLDGKDQWDSSTSLTARKVGELTGLSPKQIDNAFRTSTAGGGQNLLHGMDFAIAKATGASDDEIKGRSMLDSVVGRFYAPKGTSQSSYFYQSLEKAAKDNKLSGSDLELYQALTSRKYNGDGNVEGKTEGDVLMNNRILANKPNIVKALSEAAKWRSEQTGEELDPLYKLPVDKQQYFYHLQGSPKNGAEQRKLKQDAPWLEDFQKERSAYFKRQDFKSGKSNRVPYPEVSDELQATLKTYHDMPNSPQKWAFLDAHPELSDHYKQIEDYNNKVREAQGYAPLRTRPQQSQYVKMQMANKNWRDPAVARYLQDLNVYNITNSASLAEMQGEELSPKALKAIQSVGKYGLVKNPDGTFALKYPDGQGTNESHIQAGAVDMSSFGRRRGGRGGSSNGIRTSTDTLKLSNATALGMNAFKKNKGGLPQFSVKAIQKSGLLKSRRPTSRVVTFR